MAADWAKFARLCGLLGSDFDGERASAAAFATKWLKENKLTWKDVADRAAREVSEQPRWKEAEQPRKEPPGKKYDPKHWNEIEYILEVYDARLTSWERDFLTSILDRWSLTEKQEAVWDRLQKKYP